MRAVLPFLLLSLAACNRQPEWFPPPEQRHAIRLPDPPPLSSMVNMNDATAPDRFVRDIGALEASSWRWTQQRPTVTIPILSTKGVKYLIDFTVWDGLVKEAGPVTISFFVGDKLLDSVKYSTPGRKHFEKHVNPAWLEGLTQIEISAEIDKVHISSDGAKLGFILTRMGLQK